MKKRSKRYKLLQTSIQNKKKLEVKEIIDYVKKTLLRNLTSQLMYL